MVQKLDTNIHDSPDGGQLEIEPVAWVDRAFTFNLPIGAFPAVLERVRGTPARASELVSGAPEELLSVRWNHKWSVKEHLGHLLDLHALEEQRLREFLAGVAVLSAADPRNRLTETAGHNQAVIGALVSSFRARRTELVRKLEMLTAEGVQRSALHPRLQKSMRIVDWTYFIAEHDDHHLAWARRTLVETCLRPGSRGGR